MIDLILATLAQLSGLLWLRVSQVNSSNHPSIASGLNSAAIVSPHLGRIHLSRSNSPVVMVSLAFTPMPRRFFSSCCRKCSASSRNVGFAPLGWSAANEASIRELGDETLRKVARELTDRLRKSNSVD